MKLIIFLCIYLVISQLSHAEEETNDIWGKDAGFMEDDSQATILRHMAKQRAMQANMTDEQKSKMRENQSNGCGAVNIGNASSSDGDAEAVVIIKGDVINANNNCK